MLQNYILSAFRNIRKNFSYSAINVCGLGLGLTVSFLLMAWILDEISFDRFHSKSDRIYRVSLEYSFGGQTAKTSVSPTALLPALQKNFQEVEAGVRVYNPSGYNPFIVRVEESLFQEGHFYFADSTFFDVFSYKLVKGNPDKVLTEPKTVILTQTTAKKYFGEDDPVGRTILVNDRTEYEVTGVVEDAPVNSYLQFDFIASFSTLPQAKETDVWWSANYQTFAVLHPDADWKLVQSNANEIVNTALASELSSANDYVKYNWTSLPDLHLRSDAAGEMEPVGNINYVYFFGGIALLVLIIACINYVNLATARATDRAKEVGIRKVVGAGRFQLIAQFLGESIIITLAAFILAFLAVQLSLPGFNSLSGKELEPSQFMQARFLLYAFIAFLVISIGSGLYPAFAITGFTPVSVLKGNFKSSGKGIWLRKSLVVFQFCLSVILVVATIAIAKQLFFIQNVKLGYDKDSVLILPLDNKTERIYPQLRTEFLRSGSVTILGRATESPTIIKGGYSIQMDDVAGAKPMITTAVSVDEFFVPALGMEIIAGRNYTEADMTKSRIDTVYSFILNESAVNEFNLIPEEAIGKRMELNGRKGELVGVVKDFHFATLHEKIGPMVMFNQETEYNYMFAKLQKGDVQENLNKLKEICASITPHRPFEFQFIDQQYGALYESEERVATLCILFSSLAIIIASVGLLGLVAYSASQRMKEIGIRKVLGATVKNIVIMISGEYATLILISILVGLPLSYWAINKWWLSAFAYRTTIGAMPFVMAAGGCILIAFAAAGYQALRAALVNPTETLRSE